MVHVMLRPYPEFGDKFPTGSAFKRAVHLAAADRGQRYVSKCNTADQKLLTCPVIIPSQNKESKQQRCKAACRAVRAKDGQWVTVRVMTDHDHGNKVIDFDRVRQASLRAAEACSEEDHHGQSQSHGTEDEIDELSPEERSDTIDTGGHNDDPGRGVSKFKPGPSSQLEAKGKKRAAISDLEKSDSPAPAASSVSNEIAALVESSPGGIAIPTSSTTFKSCRDACIHLHAYAEQQGFRLYRQGTDGALFYCHKGHNRLSGPRCPVKWTIKQNREGDWVAFGKSQHNHELKPADNRHIRSPGSPRKRIAKIISPDSDSDEDSDSNRPLASRARRSKVTNGVSGSRQDSNLQDPPLHANDKESSLVPPPTSVAGASAPPPPSQSSVSKHADLPQTRVSLPPPTPLPAPAETDLTPQDLRRFLKALHPSLDGWSQPLYDAGIVTPAMLSHMLCMNLVVLDKFLVRVVAKTDAQAKARNGKAGLTLFSRHLLKREIQRGQASQWRERRGSAEVRSAVGAGGHQRQTSAVTPSMTPPAVDSKPIV